eukprot:2868963-Rhodomonas_salina.2
MDVGNPRCTHADSSLHTAGQPPSTGPRVRDWAERSRQEGREGERERAKGREGGEGHARAGGAEEQCKAIQGINVSTQHTPPPAASRRAGIDLQATLQPRPVSPPPLRRPPFRVSTTSPINHHNHRRWVGGKLRLRRSWGGSGPELS